MAKIHETKIRITSKHAQAVKGLKAVRAAAGKLTPSFNQVRSTMLLATAAAAGLTVAIFALVKSSAKAGDEFDKMSKRLDVSAQTLSELKFAAELSGASIDDIEKSMKKLSKSAVDADRGLLTYQRAFDELGVSVTDVDGNLKDTETLFNEVSQALAGLESNTKKTALAQELFGRSGTKLLPLFKEGAEGIKALREEARFLGITYSDEAAAGAAAFIDSQQRLTDSFKGVKIGIASELQEPLTGFFNTLSTLIAENRDDIADLAFDFVGSIGSMGEVVLTSGAKIVDFFDRISAAKRNRRMRELNEEIIRLRTESENLAGIGMSGSIAMQENLKTQKLLIAEAKLLLKAQEDWVNDPTALEKFNSLIAKIKEGIAAQEGRPDTPLSDQGQDSGLVGDGAMGPKTTAAQREIEQLNTMWDAQFLTEQERLEIKLGEQLTLFEGDTAAKLQVLQIFEAKKIQLAKKDLIAQAKKQAIEKQLRQKGFNDFVGNLQAIGNVSRTAFEIWKAGATAQAIITGISATQEAFRSGMSTPGPHAPFVAAAYAAAAAGAAAARVTAIQSQSYSGGGGSVNAGGGGTPSVGGFEQTPQPLLPDTSLITTDTAIPQQPASINININVEGSLVDHSGLVDELAPFLEEAVGDKVMNLNVS